MLEHPAHRNVFVDDSVGATCRFFCVRQGLSDYIAEVYLSGAKAFAMAAQLATEHL